MTERPPLGHLWHLALRVADLPRMEAFYGEVLGFRVEWRPDADNVYMTTGRDNLALHRERAAVTTEGRLAHLGLVVGRAEDVDAWAAYLAGRGVAPDAPPRTHRDGARSFYFKDPEGNVIQLIHHPPLAPALAAGPRVP